MITLLADAEYTLSAGPLKVEQNGHALAVTPQAGYELYETTVEGVTTA